MKSPFSCRSHSMLLLVMPLVLALVTACGGRSASQSGASTTGAPAAAPSGTQFAGKVLVGDLAQKTGAGGGSTVTDSTTRAMEVAIRDINAKGGVNIKGDRYELVFRSLDSRSEPAATLAGAKELIGAGAIASTVPSFANDVAYAALSQAGVISFGAAPTVTVPLLREGPAKHPLLFGVIEAAEPVIVGWLGEILSIHPEIKRVAVLNQLDPTGKIMDAAVQTGAQKYGLEYVGAEFVDPSTTDFSTPLTSLKAKRPDLIYMGTAAQIIGATKQAAQLKAAPFVWNYATRPVDLKQIGPLGDTTVMMADFRAPFSEGLTPPEYEAAIANFGKLASGEPLQAGIAAAYYDWLHLLAQAMEKAGTVKDTAAIARALDGASYNGPFGQSQVLPNHTVSGSMGIVAANADTLTLYVFKDSQSPEKPIASVAARNTYGQ